MQINSGNVVPKNRNALILVIILAILIIILLGILYFTKQQNMGEGAPGISNKPTKQHTLNELRQLTSAPENNPDIKPNMALTALTTSPEKNLSAKADSQLIGNLTAPKN
jgi:hypothetical protein